MARHALIDKVYSELNLFASARKVTGKKDAAGVDRQGTENFSACEIAEIRRLSNQLQQRTYRPKPVRRVQIPKPGDTKTRGLGIPVVRTAGRMHTSANVGTKVCEYLTPRTFNPCKGTTNCRVVCGRTARTVRR